MNAPGRRSRPVALPAIVLHAMVGQYAAELGASWLPDTSPRQIPRLKDALAGARECLALFLQEPPGEDVGERDGRARKAPRTGGGG